MESSLSLSLTISFEGINIKNVEVQVHLSNGLPSFNIVGLAEKSVSESKERIRAAFSSLGIIFPAKRITVNLSPSDLIKEGSYFDLPIALSLLSAMELIPKEKIVNMVSLGELALNGDVKPVNGVLAAALQCIKTNKDLILPAEQYSEATFLSSKLKLLPVRNIKELIEYFNNNKELDVPVDLAEKINEDFLKVDFLDIKGQETAKRALAIAATGGHNILMIGEPGSGKSMLAHALPSILPELSTKESLEISLIYSIAGELKTGNLIKKPPFRSPHHTSSQIALVGGGKKVKPGEITLAHRGVLFLDEFAEYPKNVLDSLREPLETHSISIARANEKITFPAKFQLVAAMNPCRCGYFGNGEKECSKAPICSEQYQSKISGPMLDRIDIYLEVPPANLLEITSRSNNNLTSSKDILEKVIKARRKQKVRYQNHGISINSESPSALIDDLVKITQEAKKFLVEIAQKYKFSARGYYRTLKVATSIIDYDEKEVIEKSHIAEAINYRKISYNNNLKR